MTLPTTRIGQFLPYILPYVPECPRTVAEMQLRLAAIEFCERTKGWRHIASVALTGNGQAIVAPEYTAIHLIEEATLDGITLTPTQFTDVKPDELTGTIATGHPKYITQSAHDTINVYPFRPGMLRLSLFLKPRAGSLFGTDAADPMHDAYNVVPDFLFVQHAEKLAHGALARIMAIPDQPFSDPERAMFYADAFNRTCNSQFASHQTGQQRAPMRTTSRWM